MSCLARSPSLSTSLGRPTAAPRSPPQELPQLHVSVMLSCARLKAKEWPTVAHPKSPDRRDHFAHQPDPLSQLCSHCRRPDPRNMGGSLTEMIEVCCEPSVGIVEDQLHIHDMEQLA